MWVDSSCLRVLTVPWVPIHRRVYCIRIPGEKKEVMIFTALYPLSQPHNDMLRPVLDRSQSISSPCFIVPPLLKKSWGVWAQFPLTYRQIYPNPLSNARLRIEQGRRLQLLWLPPSFPSLPLHKLNPLHWLHTCISAGKQPLFNDSMPSFPPCKIRGGWMTRRDRPLSAMLERSIWLKTTSKGEYNCLPFS